LKNDGRNLAIQGEVYGPGIQGNLLGVKDIQFRAFNLFDIDNYKYLDRNELLRFCDVNDIPVVETIEDGTFFDRTLQELQNFANNLVYENGNLAEGIVIRPTVETYSETLKGRLSGKIISEPFELKYND
jgi:ATP-dependent RNA circularization protein (DNA/RNA ligase family)